MAFKLALVSFEFESVKGITYDSQHDFDFAVDDYESGAEVCQPVIKKAFKKIRRCLTDSVSKDFHYGINTLRNVDNFLHIGYSVIHYEVQHNDNTQGQTSMVLVTKFYRLEPSLTYKVTIDLENMPTSYISASNPRAFKHGITNEQIQKFSELLSTAFHLENKIELIPLLRRGTLDIPRYLVSSDNRVLEYDFTQVLFHKRSEYQDVKIVSSPSLGNTLLLDNLQNYAEVDVNYTYALMDRGYVSYKNREILILGGGDGGLLWELLKETPKFVTMAEIDPIVIEAARDYIKPCGKVLETLEGPNYKILVEDCLKVLRQSIADGKRYDVIFNDLTDIPVSKRDDSLNAFDTSVVQRDNPWHFIELIFNLSLECLSEDGLYMTHTTGKGNVSSLEAYEDFLRGSKIEVDFESRHSYVESFMEVWVFYTIKKCTKKQKELKTR